MKPYRSAALAASVGLIFSGATPVAAKNPAPPQARARLAIVGTAVGGATFAGTLSLERFAVRGSSAVAVGMITGTVTDSARYPDR